MNNHMSLKLVGANSSLELNSPITSIYLQEELTGLTTLPGIRETKGMNIGMDGGWTSAQFYEPRLITIKGVIANQDVAVVEQRRKQLIQLLAEKRLALEFQTEAGNHYTMNVVVAGVQMPLSKVLTASYFQINLRADDPLIYDNNALAELEAILRRSSSASSGFTINFPINFQLGTSESRPTIDNFGSSVIYPVITLTGPLTTPEIVNITTNMAFTIDEVLGAGTYTASGIRGAMTQEGSVDTYSGNPIQATRDAESPISKFSLYGDAEQTTYSGKNLLPMASANIQGSDANTDRQKEFRANLPIGTYVISFNLDAFTLGSQTSFPIHMRLSYDNGGALDSAFISISSSTTTGRKSFVFTTTRAVSADSSLIASNIRIGLTYWNNGARATLSNIQIEAGSTATDYEPYVGGTASPNPDYPQAVNTVTGEQTVKIEGKNLFDKDNADTANGYLSGSTGAFVAGGGSYATKNATFLPAGDYVASQMLEKVCHYALDGSYIGLITRTGSNNEKFTMPSVGFVRLQFPSSFNADTFQIELGSTATTYEPYQAQTLPVNLGKNLFSGFATLATGSTFADGTLTMTQSATNTSNDFRVSPNTPYYLNWTTGAQTRVYIREYDSTGTQLTNVTKYVPYGFTTTATTAFMRVYFSPSTSETFPLTIKDIQLEKGSATSFAPYFTPIELAKIGTYQDRIYKDEGKWYVEKQVGKVVLDGSEADWATTNSGTANFFYRCRGVISDYAGTSQNNPLFISNLATPAILSSSNTDEGFMILTGAQQDVRIRYAPQMQLADWKAFLATSPMTIYYALATPTTTEITEQTLIDQLDAILEAHLYEGLNNISNVTISPNLAGDIEIKTGQTLTVINSLSIVGSSGTAEIDLGGSELAMVGSVADELTINGTTGAVTKTARIGKIESYAGETITTDYISTSGGLDSDATIYYVLPSSSTSVINTLDSTALAAFNGVVASGGVSAQTNIGSISVDVTTVTAQDVAVVDTKQHTVTINGVGAYSKFSGDWLTLDVGLNELQLITENNTDTGSAVIKYRVGYMGV